jgi:radical SAM superfamily enzyme YgiQ (UPF0313 family)
VKIALLYPPPWKIAGPGEMPPDADGPPRGFREGDLDPDFHQTPYGLFTLAANAIRAGHKVKVLNLSNFPWTRVVEIIRALDADLFGLSCWTANRRGVALVSRLIKETHPKAHVVIGGPHATPLAKEMLEHHADIDTVCLGESEPAFLELADKLQKGEPGTGIHGTYFRNAAKVEEAPERKNIADLDTLAFVHDYFPTHIVMTSRGCPWQCTFCGAETTWGRGFRGHSIPYVVDMLEKALAKSPVKMLQIKDDTFTANRKRAMDICKGIRDRKLSFLWSCDTRVDVLSEELLKEMRLAGCQRLSLGVESGSPAILKNIHKKITADDILEAAEMAKSVGIHVRFYMMLGNRGETAQTFQETLDFLDRAKPHQYLFSCLSIYPGTVDFHDAEKSGKINREIYFEQDFQELKMPYDASPEDAKLMSDWFAKNHGIREPFHEGAPEYEKILEKLGDYSVAHLDLGGAYFRESGGAPGAELDLAEKHVQRALDLDVPVPGLALNYLACIAAARGKLREMEDLFMEASKRDPQHWVLIRNVQTVRQWYKDDGPTKNQPLYLLGRHDFKLLERTVQPTLPGTLQGDYASWENVPLPVPVKAYKVAGEYRRLVVL